MRRRPSAARLSGAAALATAAACSDPLAADDVAGTYVLRSVAGEPLPAVVYATPGYTARVLADTLRLGSDGTGFATRAAVDDPPAVDAGVPYRYAQPLRYTVTAGRLAVEYLCGPAELALCAAGPHLVARVEGGGLVAEQALGQRVPQVYARVGSR